MTLRLITAYTRTGKDTFVDQVNGQLDYIHPWIVFTHPNKPMDDYKEIFAPGNKLSFAASLKKTVVQNLGLPEDFDVEANKDTYMIEGKLLRQHLIEYAFQMRQIDQAFFVKEALRDMNGDCIVSDFRFIDEYEFIAAHVKVPVTTIRLFRSSVEVPPPHIISEHDLDEFETDVLLVSSDQSYDIACDHFPQYRSYVRQN